MTLATLLMLLPWMGDPAPDVAVVCQPTAQAALQPWIEHRTQQGHSLAFVTSDAEPEVIRREIRSLAGKGRLKFVVLVGDAENSRAELTVPVRRAPSRVVVKFGSEPHIAHDGWYGDLDDDGVPDLAVGRLSVTNARQLAKVLEKTIDYEQNQDFGPWRRRINFVAGVGGLGPLADAAIEGTAKRVLSEDVPAAYATTMTYASWPSPFCPAPAAFRQTAVDRLEEGCLFWVYLGHGHRGALDQVIAPDGLHPIFDRRDAKRLSGRSGRSVACLFACYAGAFDSEYDCLAEDMLRNPGGPAAILAGSRVTMPYGMAVMGMELLDESLLRRRATLGEVVLAAKRNMAGMGATSKNRFVVDALSGLLNPGVSLAVERAEHVALMNLFGDPLLRLPHSQVATVKIEGSANAGQTLKISGSSPLEGPCMVELVVSQARTVEGIKLRELYDTSPGGLDRYAETYAKANDPRLAGSSTRVVKGHFKCDLQVPDAAQGDCHVRVFVQGENSSAAGSSKVRIEPQRRRDTIREPQGQPALPAATRSTSNSKQAAAGADRRTTSSR